MKRRKAVVGEEGAPDGQRVHKSGVFRMVAELDGVLTLIYENCPELVFPHMLVSKRFLSELSLFPTVVLTAPKHLGHLATAVSARRILTGPEGKVVAATVMSPFAACAMAEACLGSKGAVRVKSLTALAWDDAADAFVEVDKDPTARHVMRLVGACGDTLETLDLLGPGSDSIYSGVGPVVLRDAPESLPQLRALRLHRCIMPADRLAGYGGLTRLVCSEINAFAVGGERAFAECLANLPNLVSLSFTRNFGNMDTGLDMLKRYGGKMLKRLETFELKECRVSHLGLDHIHLGLSGSKSLTSLAISARQPERYDAPAMVPDAECKAALSGLASEHGSRLESLDFGGNHLDSESAMSICETLCRAECVHLKSLDIQAGNFRYVEGGNYRRLNELRDACVNLTRIDALALASSPKWRLVRAGGDPTGNYEVKTLGEHVPWITARMRACGEVLRELDLRGCRLGRNLEDFRQISMALPQCVALQKLDIRDNWLDKDLSIGGGRFGEDEAPDKPSLVTQACSHFLEVVASMPRLQTLSLIPIISTSSDLDLRSSKLVYFQFCILLDVLTGKLGSMPPLTHLRLGFNDMSYSICKKAPELSAVLRELRNRLVHVDLRGCISSEQALEEVLKGLKNGSVQELLLGRSGKGVEMQALAQMLSKNQLPHLRMLDLSGTREVHMNGACSLEYGNVSAVSLLLILRGLAAIPRRDGVVGIELRIACNELDGLTKAFHDAGGAKRLPVLTEVTGLDVSHCVLQAQDTSVLFGDICGCHMPNLVSLRAGVDAPAAAKHLSCVLAKCKRLASLDLGGWHLGPAAAQLLGVGLTGLRELTSLNSLEAPADGQCEWNLGGSVNDPVIKYPLLEAHFVTMWVRRRCECLESLILNSNGLCESGAKILASALKSVAGLKELWLQDNKLGPDGVKALVPVLSHSTTLTCLRLCKNEIGSKGAKALVSVLSARRRALPRERTGHGGEDVVQLRTLSLSYNKLRDEGLAALFGSIRSNKDLQELDLRDNDFARGAAEGLADALSKHTSITHLDCSRNPFPFKASQLLHAAIANCPNMTYINTRPEYDTNSTGNPPPQVASPWQPPARPAPSPVAMSSSDAKVASALLDWWTNALLQGGWQVETHKQVGLMGVWELLIPQRMRGRVPKRFAAVNSAAELLHVLQALLWVRMEADTVKSTLVDTGLGKRIKVLAKGKCTQAKGESAQETLMGEQVEELASVIMAKWKHVVKNA